MLKRKIYNELFKWKSEKNKKVLVVTGARQVGKTFIIENFAREYYQNYIIINFEKQPQFKQVFESDLTPDNIVSQLTLLLPDKNIVPNETVLVFDEIQSCPQAITSLKFFTEDGRFDVIATGSLLGISYKEVSSFPVGATNRLTMHSMDFEEFLWANQVDSSHIDIIKNHYSNKTTVPEAIHIRFLQLFREYIVVGGMPAVVQEYVNNKDFSKVLKLQRDIVDDYSDDIIKYAEGTEKTKARACLLSIPKQLARDYKKFRYSIVDKNGNSRKYGGSLMWLYDAGIINFCNNLSRIELPLEGNAIEDIFKVYMCDTGLLVSMLEDGSQADIINGNLGIYKGAVYENIIGDIFAKSGKKLYYYEYRSQIEMDFIIRYEDMTTAVEVKSADHTKSKSMKAILTNYHAQQGIKLSTKNVGYKDNVTTLPLYMAMFI